MDPIFIPVLAAAVGCAGPILSAVITSQGNVTGAQALNRDFLGSVINNISGQLSAFLQVTANRVLDQLRTQHIKDAVQDLQARVNAMKSLLNLQAVDPKLINQIIVTALNPLQVSMEVAKLRLADYGELETWQFCHITGSSALIAGYAFLGQDMPVFKQELDQTMNDVLRRILTDVARRFLSQRDDFPWEQVPNLLTVDGVQDLLVLFRSIEDSAQSVPQKSEGTTKKIDRFVNVIDELTGRRLRDILHGQKKS